MNQHEFDNEIVCRAVYAWVKGDGPEPYSPVVADLTVMVLDLLRMDRARTGSHYDSHGPTFTDRLNAFRTKWLGAKRYIRTSPAEFPNMEAARAAFAAVACLFPGWVRFDHINEELEYVDGNTPEWHSYGRD